MLIHHGDSKMMLFLGFTMVLALLAAGARSTTTIPINFSLSYSEAANKRRRRPF
jgi:hypothetical protein